MSKLVQILRDNADLLNNLYGNINDLQVKSKYKDVMGELSTFEKQKSEYDRYNSIADKLSSVNLGDEDYYNVAKSKAINYDDPKFKESQAFTKYNEQLKQDYLKNNPDDVNFEKANLQYSNEEFANYLAQNPDLQNEVNTSYLKDVETKTLKGKDELKNHIYSKAGLTPEDIDFYTNTKPVNPSEHNTKLSRLVYGNQNDLTSVGQYGDSYARQFQNEASLSGIVPQKEPEYQIMLDEKNGTLIYANKKDKNDRKIVQFRDPELNKKNPELDYSLVQKDADGNYFYYADVWDADKGGYVKQNLRKLDPDEIDEYERLMQMKLKEGEFAPKSGNGRSGRRSVGSGNTMTTEQQTVANKLKKLGELNSVYNSMSAKQKKQYKQLQKELIGNFDGNYDELNRKAEEVYKSSGKKKDLAKIVSEVGRTNVPTSELDKVDEQDNVVVNKKQSGKKIFAGIDYSSTYDKADQSEKQAMDSVQSWVSNILSSWGKGDPREIPADEWAREINEDKDKFSDLEWAMITNLFNTWKQ